MLKVQIFPEAITLLQVTVVLVVVERHVPQLKEIILYVTNSSMAVKLKVICDGRMSTRRILLGGGKDST